MTPEDIMLFALILGVAFNVVWFLLKKISKWIENAILYPEDFDDDMTGGAV